MLSDFSLCTPVAAPESNYQVLPLLFPPVASVTWCLCRSSSDPYAPSELEGFRPSPDPFRTYPGHNEPSRGSSPPPWYIADPHTPVVSGDFQVYGNYDM